VQWWCGVLLDSPGAAETAARWTQVRQASLSLVNSLLPQTNIWRHFFENNPEKKYEQYFNYSVEKIFLKKKPKNQEEETAITHPTLQKYKVPQVYFMIFASNETP